MSELDGFVSWGEASCGLRISWTILWVVSVGHSKDRKSMARRQEGRRKGSSLIEYGGSPQETQRKCGSS